MPKDFLTQRRKGAKAQRKTKDNHNGHKEYKEFTSCE